MPLPRTHHPQQRRTPDRFLQQKRSDRPGSKGRTRKRNPRCGWNEVQGGCAMVSFAWNVRVQFGMRHGGFPRDTSSRGEPETIPCLIDTPIVGGDTIVDKAYVATLALLTYLHLSLAISLSIQAVSFVTATDIAKKFELEIGSTSNWLCNLVNNYFVQRSIRFGFYRETSSQGHPSPSLILYKVGCVIRSLCFGHNSLFTIKREGRHKLVVIADIGEVGI
eukprot:scaffold2637_cov421-Pavlova_lutheri.AAC.12